ncbi:hypothetical protein INT45_000973 [Circinella minor]|uniref:Mei2-like C-terminal RNA recognition motif domain-containing protein n=1 Tax=Circinella minor TaxID=1195481 RepID=A0A8H7RW78_9FUNG|nr:hypothetical protein INT45_000973 [Circinella minor]
MQPLNPNVAFSKDHPRFGVPSSLNRLSSSSLTPPPLLQQSNSMVFNPAITRPREYGLSPFSSRHQQTELDQKIVVGNKNNQQHYQRRCALGNLTNTSSSTGTLGLSSSTSSYYYQKQEATTTTTTTREQKSDYPRQYQHYHSFQKDSNTTTTSTCSSTALTSGPLLLSSKFDPFSPSSLMNQQQTTSFTRYDNHHLSSTRSIAAAISAAGNSSSSSGGGGGSPIIVPGTTSGPSTSLTLSSNNLSSSLEPTMIVPSTVYSSSAIPTTTTTTNVPSCLTYGGVNTSSLTVNSDTPVSRHLCITNIQSDNDVRTVMRTIQVTGSVKSTFGDFLHSQNMLTVSFYDLRIAMDVLQTLKSSFLSFESYEGIRVNYISDSMLTQIYGIPLQDSRSDSTVIISLSGAYDDLMAFNYKEFFDKWGDPRSTIEMHFSGNRRTIEVEFYDQRAASNIASDLPKYSSQGITFQVSGSNWRDTTMFTPTSSSNYMGFPMSLSPSPTTSTYFTGSNMNTSSISGNIKQEQQQLYMNQPSLQQQQQQSLLLEFGDSIIKDQDHRSNTFLHHLNQTTDNQQGSDSDDTDSLHHRYHSNDVVITPPTSTSGGTFSLFANTPPFCSRDLLSTSSGSPEQHSSSTESTLHQQLQQYNRNSHSTIHPMKSRSFTPSSTSRRSGSSTRYELTSSYSYQDNTFDIHRVRNGTDIRTTFMIRNIPNKYTQEMLKECIDATHSGTYDFLYLRIDFQNKCNVGYAFINFVDVNSVITFARERVGKRWNRFNSEKRCSISYANIQGKQALIEKFQNSTVMDEEESYRPKIYYSSGPQKGEEEVSLFYFF